MSQTSGVPSLMTFYFSQMSQQLYRGKAPEFPMGNWDDFYFHVNDAKDELDKLEKELFKVYLPQRIPVNDQGIAAGQLAIGAHRRKLT